jgi:hypothetical protein
LFIGGAHNITVNDFQAIGCKLGGVAIDVVTLNNIFSAAGNIAPVPPITTAPLAVIVDNPVVREFVGFGIKQAQGFSEVRTPYAKSSLPGAIGLQVLAGAAVRGSLMIGGTGDCPLGTDLDVIYGGVDCRGVNTNNIRDRRISRLERQEIRKVVTGLPNPVCNLFNQSGVTTTYAGQMYILARSSSFDSASCANYWLDIILPINGGTPVVSVVKSSGLTSGVGVNDPSFIFSIVGNQLVATAVGSTSTTKAWDFNISSFGDLSLT